jgi:multifunctional beta-oxidation protein
LFEVTGGWAGQTRWQRAGGHCFPNDKPYTPEDVLDKWNIITNFGEKLPLLSYVLLTLFADDGRATHPSSTSEAMEQLVGNFENKAGELKAKL